eukprot:353889-Chlamydomonas_euryale.AAC.2
MKRRPARDSSGSPLPAVQPRSIASARIAASPVTGVSRGSCGAGCGRRSPYVASRFARPTRATTMSTGDRTSVRRSIGMTPAATISAFDAAKRGMTSPGQSHSMSPSPICSVWKCFVLPGVGATDVFLVPNSALIVLLLPTLGKPTSPTTARRAAPPSEPPTAFRLSSGPASATASRAAVSSSAASSSPSSTRVRKSSPPLAAPSCSCCCCRRRRISSHTSTPSSPASERSSCSASVTARADQNAYRSPLRSKWSAHAARTCCGRRSALFSSTSDALLGCSSRAYAARSDEKYSSGSRASTTWVWEVWKCGARKERSGSLAWGIGSVHVPHQREAVASASTHTQQVTCPSHIGQITRPFHIRQVMFTPHQADHMSIPHPADHTSIPHPA